MRRYLVEQIEHKEVQGPYIVPQIVLGHDGTIGVDSTAHAGTTFTLHLPRQAAMPVPAPHQ